jgi:PAS domain S-box-containing protein
LSDWEFITMISGSSVADPRLLHHSEERYRTLVEAIAAMVWSRSATGEFETEQPDWSAFTGQSFEELRGWGWLDTIHLDDRAATIEGWVEALAQGTRYEIEHRVRRHDGEYRYMVARAVPLPDGFGGVREWAGLHIDIHERTQAAGERLQLLESERAARGEAERANRLKDDFVATLSHELRTPLHAILGWTQILQRKKDDPKVVDQGLQVIERNARAQSQMISDLLDMSRIISGKMRLEVQAVDLAAVVESATEAVRLAAETKGIDIVEAIDREDGIITGDPDRLRQVVWNLLSNAIKFTPAGGTVRVELARAAGHVEIRVSDTGQGFDPAFAPYLFDRFRQADASITRRSGGLGLGLAIVKQFVELHGGTVTAASPGEGKGATFTILLPHTAPEQAGEAPGRPPAAGSAAAADEACVTLNGVRVLVVDDQDDARELLERVFTECGALVEVVDSAAEALEAVRRRRPDVLVSDLGMPGEDGYELVRRLRALPPDQGGATPAAAVSALARPEDRKRALQAGYQVHVAKPVEAAELLAAVARLVEGASSPISSL